MNELTALAIFQLLCEFRCDLNSTRVIELLFNYLDRPNGKKEPLTAASPSRSYVFNTSSGEIKWKRYREGIITNPAQFLSNLKMIVTTDGVDDFGSNQKAKKLLNDLYKLCSPEQKEELEKYISSKDSTVYDVCANVVFVLFMIAIDPDRRAIDFCLTQQERARLVRTGRGFHEDKENHDVTVQTIYKKSCEKLPQQKRLLKYEIIPQLIPNPDVDISKHDYILLVAEGGAGKTSFLLDHWAKLLDSNAAETKALPIYVPLNRFEGNDEFFIRNYIRKHYFSSQDGLDFDDWIKSAKDCNVVLLLDAINEAKNSRVLGSEIEELCSFGFKIILTSRHEMDGWGSLETFKRAHLLPLSSEIVDNQLKSHHLKVSEQLRPLLTKPIYLTLLLGIGDAGRSVESPGELFLAHHKWIKKMFSADKHGPAYQKQGDRLLGSVLPNLATRTKTIVFSDTDVAEILNSFSCDSDEALAILCETGIIIDDGFDEYKAANVYRWKHEFFLQFYQSMRIWQQMGYSTEKRTFQAIKYLPQELLQRDIDEHVLDFLGDVLESQFVGKNSITSPMSPIEKWLQDNCRSQSIASKQHGIDEVQFCTANLIKTMILAREGHLEHTVFDGLDLQKAEFYDCWLTGSRFFQSENLHQDCFFSHHRFPPVHFAGSAKHGLLFSSSFDESHIVVWNYSTGEVRTVVKNDGNVLSLAISPDEKWLAVALETSPYTIKLFDLDDLIHYNTDYSRVISCESEAFAFVRVFFDSQSEILLCLSAFDGYCERWRLDGQKLTPLYLNYSEDDFNSEMAEITTLFTRAMHQRISSVRNKIFIKNGSQIASYDIHTGMSLSREFNGSEILDFCITPDGKRLIVLSSNSTEFKHLQIIGLVPGVEDYTISDQWLSSVHHIIATNEEVVGCGLAEAGTCAYVWYFAEKKAEKPKRLDGMGHQTAYVIPNTEVIVYATGDAHIETVDLRLQKRRTLRGHSVQGYSVNVCFTEKEGVLYRRWNNGDIFLLDIAHKKASKVEQTSTFLKKHQNSSVCRFNGRYLFAVTETEGTAIWDVLNDKLEDIIPEDGQRITKEFLVQTGQSEKVLVTISESKKDNEVFFSAWRIPEHRLIGRLKESLLGEQLHFCKRQNDDYMVIVNGQTCVPWKRHSLDFPDSYCSQKAALPATWDKARNVYLLIPNQLIVVVGYYHGAVRFWDIVSGHFFEEQISETAIEQICAIPNSCLISIVSRDGCVTIYDTLEKRCVSQWSASEPLFIETGRTLSEEYGLCENNTPIFTLSPITKEISILDYKLHSQQTCNVFVNHLSRGTIIGTVEPGKRAASRRGNTLIVLKWQDVYVYDIPHLRWKKKREYTVTPPYVRDCKCQ